jgi:outer membrane protein OmpA-like peptidoglycan-associated protein
LQQGEQPTDEEPVDTVEDTEAAPAGESTVEQQLEAQGDEADADRLRELRRKLRRARQEAEEAPEEAPEAEEEETAEERDRRDGPDERERGRVVERRGDRIIIDLGGGRVRVEPVTRDESERLLYGARDVEVQRLRNGRTRTIVYRDNGSQIITTRDRHGNIIRRIRRTPEGREFVLIDNRFPDRPRPIVLFQPLPPPVITIPQEQYIVDLGQASPAQIQQALLAPPVQELEQSYTLEEVTTNESIRAYVPRIDLDTITFEFGSATIGQDQMPALEELGFAMEEVIADNPSEVYLIEGHTDAVGSDYDNLILSDRRAEAVAVALSQNFEIPPENLVTEGYGEQYLKVQTEAPERANRRVTVRRITPLLQTSQAEQ